MTNAPCTPIAPDEEAALLDAFPRYLSEEDETLARCFFQPIVFYIACKEDRKTRRCICTSCMEGFYADKRTSPAFFKARHGQRCECPNCGQAATLKAAEKFTYFGSLISRERAVQLTARGDWLLVQAGWITRTFDHHDLGGYLNFEPFRRYAFAPGKRVMWGWRTVSWMGERGVDGPWERKESIREPFQRQPYEREAAYIPLGVENLAVSSLRWCQYDRWFNDEFGAWVGDLDWDMEPFRIAWLVNYLAEYTRRPQMEFLAKLGHNDVLRELVILRKPHGALLDWRAKTPPSFFRLSKAEYRAFADAGLGLPALERWRELRKNGLSFPDFLRGRAECGEQFSGVLRGCASAKVSLNRAVSYLRRQAKAEAIHFHHAARFWLDYLDAARTLDYDLSREDAALPKRLRERHDQATAAVEVMGQEKLTRRYRAVRYPKLAAQFAFERDSLCVRVPAGVEEIIAEGRTLRHCVGGYAERHVNGKVTILFLRKMKNPEAPYVTMELSTEANCEKLRIVQIHGFENDRHAKEPPEKRHAGFLALWLDWVHRGSPRRADGAPEVPEAERGPKAGGQTVA